MAAAFKAQGNAALAAGDYAGAIAAYGKAIEIDPSDHVFFSNRSAAYLSSGDADAALKDAERCIELAPTWAKGYGRRGAALHGLHMYVEAIEAYEAGLKVDAANVALRDGLAEARAAQEAEQRRFNGQSPLGGADAHPFANALARVAANPKLAAYLADDAFVAKLRALQSDPNALGTALSSSMGKGSDPRLLEVISFLLRLNLSGVAGAGFGGAAAGGNEQDDESFNFPQSDAAPQRNAPPPRQPEPKPEPAPEPLDMSEEAVEARRVAAEAAKLKAAGTAAYKARDFVGALESYRAAAALQPNDISHCLNVAAAHFEAGDYAEAISVCRAAIDHGRTVQAPFALVGKAFARIGNAHVKRNELREAIDAYESSLVESQSEDVRDRLKKAKSDLKRQEEEAYVNPELGAQAKERGNEAFKTGDFPRAVAEYTEAVKRDPTSAVYLTNRAAARTKLMDFNAALEDCDKALKLDPVYVRAFVRRGALQLLMKEYHKAMDSYNAALKLEPGNREAMEGLERTIMRINADAGGKADEERSARAMADPEVQAILRDPMVSQALQDMQRDPAAMRTVMSDPAMAAKIRRLIAAGVISVSGGGGSRV